MRFPDFGFARAQVRLVVREALRDRPTILGAVAADEIEKELADAYRASYRWRACREAEEQCAAGVVGLLAVVFLFVPYLALSVPLGLQGGFPAVIYYFAGSLAGWVVAINMLVLIDTMSGRSLFLISVSFSVGLFGGAYVLWQQVGSATASLTRIAESFWLTTLTGAIVVPMLHFLVLVPTSVAVTVFQNRRAARTQPQTALLSQLFALTLALTEPQALITHRASLLRRLNHAALVLETGLWREAHLTNPVSRATWRARCLQCAQHLRSFDLAIVLPRRDTREYLLAETVGLVHVLVRGCLDELPTADPRPRRKLAAFGAAVRSLLLGLIPLALVFSAKFAGLDLTSALGGALLVAATAWFALTVLTTLDSQAASRISLLKDAADAMSKLRGGKA